MDKAQRPMDYAATYPDAYLRYYASDIVLHCDSDASYLVVPKARSRYAVFFISKQIMNSSMHQYTLNVKH